MKALLIALPALFHLAAGLWIIARLRRPFFTSDSAVPLPAAPDTVCLVAARNESARIEACLEALMHQTLPLCVVVIDDDSEDDTASRARAWIPRFGGRLRVISGGPGKAMALQAGLESTTEAVILTTDADCRPPPQWAAAMRAHLLSGEAGALGGCTMVRAGEDSASMTEALDWAILLATAASLSESGAPITAMGNNMAFRRQALEEIGGFSFAASSVTEDYALFRRIAETRPVALHMSPALVNWTEPLRSFTGLFRQRRRWALGGASSGGAIESAILLGSLAAYLSPLVLLGGAAPAAGAALIVARWAVGLGVADSVATRLRVPLPLYWVPVHDLVVMLYTVLIPLTLPFSGKTRWKGRVLTEGRRL